MGVVVRWGSEFELGIDDIDDQHRELADVLDRLRLCMGQCAGAGELESLLGELEARTLHHFRYEEQAMTAAGFPGLEPHRANHRAFERRVSETHQLHRAGHLVELPTVSLLQGWLFEHIERADREYADYMLTHRRPRFTLARLFGRGA
ncbi:MAG: bacteriohemerythrin [Rhodocyclaceae bacterium]|nr:bacteriohemerythrin [Rhodocyclaceae bacterium]